MAANLSCALTVTPLNVSGLVQAVVRQPSCMLINSTAICQCSYQKSNSRWMAVPLIKDTL